MIKCCSEENANRLVRRLCITCFLSYVFSRYIRNQLEEDYARDQISIKKFTGERVK